MTSVIIAAAGLGKRLYYESLELPKPLFQFEQKPILGHLIEYYNKISNNIFIVISDNFNGQMIKAWVNDFYKNPSFIKFIVQPEALGTNDAVKRCLGHINDDFIVSWSDFIIKSNVSIFKDLKEDIFFTSNCYCRFSIVNNKIKNIENNSGFPGIYYFKSKPELNNCEDLIENFIGQEKNYKNINIINLGTISEIIENKSFDNKSNRYFNSITYHENQVIKCAKTPEAKLLQKYEFNWYMNAPSSIKQNIQKVAFYENKIYIDKIDGVNVSEINRDELFWKEQLPRLLDNLHVDQIKSNSNDCKKEYFDKPKKRLEQVNNIIKTWFGDEIIINGVDYSNFKTPEYKDYSPEYFCYIHGDLQFSNMMEENGILKLIDPRGYFGDSKLYGDPAYDIAKILYAVDCYHEINEGKFNIHRIEGNNILICSIPELSINEKWFFNWACDKYNISNEKLNYLLFSIWLSLTGYIINNPLAVVAAYAKSIIRLNNLLIKK